MAKTRFGNLDGIHQIRKKNFLSSTLISAGLFVAVFLIFLYIVSQASAGTYNEQRENLQAAIDRAIIQCYVTEGRYPESFEYLQKNYGIIYDDELFRVDYVIYGSNMKPDVTIIKLQ
ncbi:MAG: hypothetical protein IJR96_09030 [Pseudobutyrivibrio sp.]|nr:hypothetical protein [Pseudobutyrivibrio sp.]